MTNFEMLFRGPPEGLDDPKALRSLCRKEVQRFEEYVIATDPNFNDGQGFAKFEKNVLEGYLYQKVKGHIDAFHSKDADPVEGQNG